jgi:hypothetical protein
MGHHDLSRALRVVLVVAALVAAFTLGLYRGIAIGVEETTRFYWRLAPEPEPMPAHVDSA